MSGEEFYEAPRGGLIRREQGGAGPLSWTVTRICEATEGLSMRISPDLLRVSHPVRIVSTVFSFPTEAVAK
jgi:hypothetical protein